MKEEEDLALCVLFLCIVVACVVAVVCWVVLLGFLLLLLLPLLYASYESYTSSLYRLLYGFVVTVAATCERPGELFGCADVCRF